MKKHTLFIIAIYFLLFQNLFSQIKPITYTDGKQKLNGLLATPKKSIKTKAGVLILPAWMGIDDNSKKSAEKLSELGYHTFVADIYGEGNYPKDVKKAAELSGYYKNNPAEYHKRIKLALHELVKGGADSNNIVVIGYCFGGTGALEAARINLPIKGVVSFHGGLGRDTTRTITKINPKVLVCHGADDFFVPEAQVKSFQNEMRKADADWQMIYYANAVHSFTDVNAGNDPSKGVAYNANAAKRSWALMLAFINELVK